jgi:hypothetical protein
VFVFLCGLHGLEHMKSVRRCDDHGIHIRIANEIS